MELVFDSLAKTVNSVEERRRKSGNKQQQQSKKYTINVVTLFHSGGKRLTFNCLINLTDAVARILCGEVLPIPPPNPCVVTV